MKMDIRKSVKASNYEQEAPFLPYPSKLFVETTTFCNLRCPMCVKQSCDSRVIDGDMSRETFAALEPAFPRLESLVLNGIGEPLMHPHLLEWIARARSAMPDSAWIGFQSNGLLLDQQIARKLVEAGLDRICLSVDGVKPETFSKVRQGEDLSDMDRAFALLAEARRSQSDCRLKVGAEFVTMLENFRQLPDTIRWVAERGADFFIVSQTLPYDSSSVKQTTYHNASEAAIELFDKWKKHLAEMDLDIYLYDYMSWERERVLKHTVDPRIAQVNTLVNQMRKEARRTDVFLDVIQMLRRDSALQAEVMDTYAEAQQVADELGIALKLPVTTPLAVRKCDFVTGGSAFISWYGGVHPCYYLWHQYRCYINDWDRLVKVKEFGNVNHRPLLDIWNSDEFRTFRGNVVKFDYPYCANCCVAPCDLVQEEDFVHDCFANNEPCGSCQWAMGLLQCLQ
ncbi:MAG: radical SAM/SPASM family putative metalloenzyme maturase [Syntrophotaleaceae bacterium]